jgi:hypothetical protein
MEFVEMLRSQLASVAERLGACLASIGRPYFDAAVAYLSHKLWEWTPPLSFWVLFFTTTILWVWHAISKAARAKLEDNNRKKILAAQTVRAEYRVSESGAHLSGFSYDTNMQKINDLTAQAVIEFQNKIGKCLKNKHHTESSLSTSIYKPWPYAMPKNLKYELELGVENGIEGQIVPFARGFIVGSDTDQTRRLLFVNLHTYKEFSDAGLDMLYLRSMFGTSRDWVKFGDPEWIGVPQSRAVIDEMSKTAKDLVAIELPERLCARYGWTKAPREFDRTVLGTLHIFKWEGDQLLYAEGPVHELEKYFERLTAAHGVSTEKGQSGAVLYKFIDQKLVPYAMHMAGTEDAERFPYNLCINTVGLRLHRLRYNLIVDNYKDFLKPPDFNPAVLDMKIETAAKFIEESRKKPSIFRRSKHRRMTPLQKDQVAAKRCKYHDNIERWSHCKQMISLRPECKDELSIQKEIKFLEDTFDEINNFFQPLYPEINQPAVVPMVETDEQTFDVQRTPHVVPDPSLLVTSFTTEAKGSLQARKAKNARYGYKHPTLGWCYPGDDGKIKYQNQDSYLNRDDWEEFIMEQNAHEDIEEDVRQKLWGNDLGSAGYSASSQGSLTGAIGLPGGRRARERAAAEDRAMRRIHEDDFGYESALSSVTRNILQPIAEGDFMPLEQDAQVSSLQADLKILTATLKRLREAKINQELDAKIKAIATDLAAELAGAQSADLTVNSLVEEAKRLNKTVPPHIAIVNQHIKEAIPIRRPVEEIVFKDNSVLIHVIGLDGLCSAGFAKGLSNREPTTIGSDGTTMHGLIDDKGHRLREIAKLYKVGDIVVSNPTHNTNTTIVHLIGKQFSCEAPSPKAMASCVANLATFLKDNSFEFIYFPALGAGCDQKKVSDRDLAAEWFQLVGPVLDSIEAKKYIICPNLQTLRWIQRKPRHSNPNHTPHSSPAAAAFNAVRDQFVFDLSKDGHAQTINDTLPVYQLNLASSKYGTCSLVPIEKRVQRAEAALNRLFRETKLDLTPEGPLSIARNEVLIEDLEKIPALESYYAQVRKALGTPVQETPECFNDDGFPMLEQSFAVESQARKSRYQPQSPDIENILNMTRARTVVAEHHGDFIPLAPADDIAPLPFKHNLKLPPLSERAVESSLRKQMQKRKNGSFKAHQSAIDKEVTALSNTLDPVDPLSDLVYIDCSLRALYDSLEKEKSQGWTEALKPGTKAVWDSPEDFAVLIKFVKCRLFVRHVFGLETIKKISPRDAVYYGLKDPEKLFIKDEPHPEKKFLEDRFRLIWAPSLADTLLLGLSTRRFDKQNISCYQFGDISEYGIGMGHHDLGLLRTGQVMGSMVANAFRAGQSKISGADYSGYDFSMPRDAFMEVSKVRKNKVERSEARVLEYEAEWADFLEYAHTMLDIEHLLLSAHVVAVAERLYTVRAFGIVGSGTLVTGSNNTMANILMTRAAGADELHCVSDDNVYRGHVRKDILSDFGLVLKETVDCPIIVSAEGNLSVLNVPFTSHLYSVQAIPPDFTGEEDIAVVTPSMIPSTTPSVSALYANPAKMFSNILFKVKGDGRAKPFTLDPEIIAGIFFALRHTKYLSYIFQEFLWTMNPRAWVDLSVSELLNPLHVHNPDVDLDLDSLLAIQSEDSQAMGIPAMPARPVPR